MYYKKKNKSWPTAILAADIHLREDQPICRTDNYWEAQARKIKAIWDLQDQYDIPVIVAGDIFHKWNASHKLVSWAIEHLPENLHVIPGNHDLPQHNVNLIEKSALNVLAASERANVLPKQSKRRVARNTLVFGYDLNDNLTGIRRKSEFHRIAVCHTMVWMNQKPFKGCTSPSAAALMSKMPGYDLILTGDNHKSFHVRRNGQLLINPGSMMRMKADQRKHKPKVYLWFAETNEYEIVYLPAEENAITRDHIDITEERDQRMAAFVERLDGEFEVSLSFENNLKEFLNTNKVSSEARRMIREIME